MSKHRQFRKPAVKDTSSLIHVPTLPNYDHYKPAFSFREMKYRGNVCLSICDDSTKAAVANKLLKLSQLTWREIYSQPRDKLGRENIPYAQFKIPLPPTVTKEMSLIVFRFSDSGRMAGYRQQDTFHIVAVSAAHSLY